MEQGAPSGILSPPELTPLEQEVLDEYERLADNMNKVWHSCPSIGLETDALSTAGYYSRTPRIKP